MQRSTRFGQYALDLRRRSGALDDELPILTPMAGNGEPALAAVSPA